MYTGNPNLQEITFEECGRQGGKLEGDSEIEV